MLTSSVNVIIQLLILYTCKMLLLIHYTLILYRNEIDTVTGLPLTTLLHLISEFTLSPRGWGTGG